MYCNLMNLLQCMYAHGAVAPIREITRVLNRFLFYLKPSDG
jgi:hypothetical protein